MNIKDKDIITDLPAIKDDRGNLSFIESKNHIPFEIKRVYWIYDVPGGETRGGHAYKELNEYMVALSGSFDLVLNDGKDIVKYHLNRSYYGILIPKMTWRHLENFSTNSVCMVLASEHYNESDYIRDFDQFESFLKV